jgi:hypothetical protein
MEVPNKRRAVVPRLEITKKVLELGGVVTGEHEGSFPSLIRYHVYVEWHRTRLAELQKEINDNPTA